MIYQPMAPCASATRPRRSVSGSVGRVLDFGAVPSPRSDSCRSGSFPPLVALPPLRLFPSLVALRPQAAPVPRGAHAPRCVPALRTLRSSCCSRSRDCSRPQGVAPPPGGHDPRDAARNRGPCVHRAAPDGLCRRGPHGFTRAPRGATRARLLALPPPRERRPRPPRRRLRRSRPRSHPAFRERTIFSKWRRRSRAASCSASFLLFPWPPPQGPAFTTTSTAKSFWWSGPFSLEMPVLRVRLELSLHVLLEHALVIREIRVAEYLVHLAQKKPLGELAGRLEPAVQVDRPDDPSSVSARIGGAIAAPDSFSASLSRTKRPAPLRFAARRG